MEAFFISTGVVALGEMGDKTQLLAMLLAAKFRKPVPIILGILVATLANHAMAGALGDWVAKALGPDVLRWVIGLSFLAMAAWMLVPDAIDEDDVHTSTRWGVFGTTVAAFFLAEMGDKTQIATVALAARYSDLVAVGRYLFTQGNSFSGVPACATCHGPKAAGTPQLPRLAGQHPRYIEDQLAQFNKRERTNDNAVMHTIASKLTELETHALAEYLATLD